MTDSFLRVRIRSTKHVADEDLLGYMDGEIGHRRARAVLHHLEECWGCRTRYEEIQTTIVHFMGHRKHKSGSMAPPADAKARLIARLKGEDLNTGRTWCARAMHNGLLRISSGLNPVFAAGLFAAVAGLTFFWVLHNTPTVSASELLNRAEVSESHAVGERVVISQRIRIRAAALNFDRTVYRDSAGQRRARALELTQAVLQLKSRFETAGIDWRQPLAAADVDRWRDRLPDKQDVVSADTATLTLTTKTQSGPVVEQRFTVRKADFHPVGRRVVLRDFGAIEISELNYEEMAWSDKTAAAVFEPDVAPSRLSLEPRQAPQVLVSEQPTAQELDEAELRVRLALNEANADSEQIAIRQAQSRIHVMGIVESEARKQELQNALKGISFVDTSIETVQEISQRPAGPTSQSRVQNFSVSNDSQLQVFLAAKNQTSDQIAEFSRQLVETNLEIQREVRALDMLSNRFPDGQLGRLSSDGYRVLKQLIRRHQQGLEKAIAAERGLIARWISTQQILSTTEPGNISHEGIMRLALKTRQLFDELMSNSRERKPDVILGDLDDSLQRIEVILIQLEAPST